MIGKLILAWIIINSIIAWYLPGNDELFIRLLRAFCYTTMVLIGFLCGVGIIYLIVVLW